MTFQSWLEVEMAKLRCCSSTPKNVNLVNLVSTVQDMLMPQIMEVDEEPDVQIIGYSPPGGALNNNTAPASASHVVDIPTVCVRACVFVCVFESVSVVCPVCLPRHKVLLV